MYIIGLLKTSVGLRLTATHYRCRLRMLVVNRFILKLHAVWNLPITPLTHLLDWLSHACTINLLSNFRILYHSNTVSVNVCDFHQIIKLYVYIYTLSLIGSPTQVMCSVDHHDDDSGKISHDRTYTLPQNTITRRAFPSQKCTKTRLQQFRIQKNVLNSYRKYERCIN